MKPDTPAGWHTLTPRIFARDPEKLVDYLKTVFQAEGEYSENRPAELRIGDSMLMVSGTEMRGSYSACMYVYVSDVDETFRLAVSHGSEVIEEPVQTPYGDRRAVVQDPWGNWWQIARYRSL